MSHSLSSGHSSHALRQHKQKKEEHHGEQDVLDGQPIQICDYPSFNIGTGLCILVNAVLIGIETDLTKPGDPRAESESGVNAMFYISENIFCFIFFMELAIRLYCVQYAFFKSVWNILDFVLVVVSLMDVWVLTPLSKSGAKELDLSFLAALRVVRLLRLVRLVRLLRMFKALWFIVQGLSNCIVTLGWVSLLMILFLYVCAIFVTTQIGQNDEFYDPYFQNSRGWDHEVFFGSVSRSMFTLFQILTMDSWAEGIVRHVVANQPTQMIFFLFFISITSFMLLNMIVGVIVENTMQMGKSSEEAKKRQLEMNTTKVIAKLRQILEEADEDGSGTLSLEEFQDALADPEINQQLRLIDFPVNDPQEIFMLLDSESDGELKTEEFLQGCMRMRGPAKSKDLLEVQIQSDLLARKLTLLDEKLGIAADRVTMLNRKTGQMCAQAEQVFLDPRERAKRDAENSRNAGEESLRAFHMCSRTFSGPSSDS